MAESKASLRSRIRAGRREPANPDGPSRTAAQLLATARRAGLLSVNTRPAEVEPVTIAAYIAAPGEPDVALIRSAVRSAGGSVLVPVPGPEGTLGWAFDDGRYQSDPRLPVPIPRARTVGTGITPLLDAGVRVMLMPALAVDRAGGRLGQGGGYYDRLLAACASADVRVLTVGVVFDDELLEAATIPREAHDLAVMAVLTPSGFLRLPA